MNKIYIGARYAGAANYSPHVLLKYVRYCIYQNDSRSNLTFIIAVPNISLKKWVVKYYSKIWMDISAGIGIKMHRCS